jgi:hypothetical protein
MLIRIKSNNHLAKADRIAAAHGCQILDLAHPPLQPHGSHPKGTRSLETLDIYRHEPQRMQAALDDLRAAGCIHGVAAAPKPPVLEWVIYRHDTGDVISRHHTEDAARAKASQLTQALRHAEERRMGRRPLIHVPHVPTDLAVGPRGARWSVARGELVGVAQEWAPAGDWQRA